MKLLKLNLLWVFLCALMLGSCENETIENETLSEDNSIESELQSKGVPAICRIPFADDLTYRVIFENNQGAFIAINENELDIIGDIDGATFTIGYAIPPRLSNSPFFQNGIKSIRLLSFGKTRRNLSGRLGVFTNDNGGFFALSATRISPIGRRVNFRFLVPPNSRNRFDGAFLSFNFNVDRDICFL